MKPRSHTTLLRRHSVPLLALWVLCAALAAPILAAAEDSETRLQEFMVEMRGGVRLATDVYLPRGEGPWPVVLQRTPYNKAGAGRGAGSYTDHGYAFVVQDQRGRYRSEGVYTPHENELEDGYDTVEWIAGQPWSNGKVGISGASAVGIAANLAAAARPPHLVAAFVTVAPESLFYEGRFIGGLFKEADTGNWMRGQGVSEDDVRAYMQRVVLDERWQEKDLIFLRHNIEVPIYNVGGWYDLFLQGTLNNYRYLQEWGRPGARGHQKVLVGPFGHGALSGDLDYGYDRAATRDEELRWFDHWLKGIDNGITEEPPIQYYMMASARAGKRSPKNGFRTADQWPPNGSHRVRLYLAEDLGLDWNAPMKTGSKTSYQHDPANPVPTVGGLNLTLPRGPMDQREIPDRADYLRFETAPLKEDLVLAGELDMELWASTDGPDTDFIVKLVDVYPDGYEALVIDTGIRTRYRHGRRAEDVEPMTPGEPERLDIDLWHTGITFEKGHRLAVHIASSNYPRFEVNRNTGEAPGESSLAPRVATNTVFHDRDRPSAIVLPVLAQE